MLMCSSPLAKQFNVTGSFRRDDIFFMGLSKRAGSNGLGVLECGMGRMERVIWCGTETDDNAGPYMSWLCGHAKWELMNEFQVIKKEKKNYLNLGHFNRISLMFRTINVNVDNFLENRSDPIARLAHVIALIRIGGIFDDQWTVFQLNRFEFLWCFTF